MQVKVTTTGYKRNSPDVNEPIVVIPSGNISMHNVDFPVMAITPDGNYQIMQPEQNYVFNSKYIFEVPLRNSFNMSGNMKTWANQTGICKGATFGGSNGVVCGGMLPTGQGVLLPKCYNINPVCSTVPASLKPPVICNATCAPVCNSTQAFTVLENEIGQTIGLTPTQTNSKTVQKKK